MSGTGYDDEDLDDMTTSFTDMADERETITDSESVDASGETMPDLKETRCSMQQCMGCNINGIARARGKA